MHCACKGKDKRKNWVVVDYRCNYSAFNGYKFTRSDYSAVRCTSCGFGWRTKAGYVDSLPVEPSRSLGSLTLNK